MGRPPRPLKAIWLIVKPEDESKNGVYKITFGDRYYIGCTGNSIKKRIRAHEWFLNDAIIYSNDPLKYYLAGMFYHLIYNRKIKQGIVEILEEYPTFDETMRSIEAGWIEKLSLDGNCLNTYEHLITPLTPCFREVLPRLGLAMSDP